MNSTAFSLLANNNSKVDRNQISFGAVDFQPHPPAFTLVFASLDQEMDLIIGSLNFHVGALDSTCLSDLTKLDPSTGKTVRTAKSESSAGSSGEVNSPLSFTITGNIEDTIEELEQIMENLDLGQSTGHSEFRQNSAKIQQWTSPPETAVSPTTYTKYVSSSRKQRKTTMSQITP
jgi:hypothetical protein